MEQGRMYERTNRKTGFRHKSHYHKYFQGYTEVRVKKPNGRYRIERVYTAPWKQHDMTQSRWILQKVIYLVLSLLSVICVAASMAVDALSNYVWFVFLPGILAFLAAFLLCACAVSYATKPRKMTLGEFTGAVRGIRRAALVTLVCAAVTTLAKLVSAILLETLASASEWKAVLLLFAAVVGAAVICAAERKTNYIDIPNHTSKPINGEEIW